MNASKARRDVVTDKKIIKRVSKQMTDTTYECQRDKTNEKQISSQQTNANMMNK